MITRFMLQVLPVRSSGCLLAAPSISTCRHPKPVSLFCEVPTQPDRPSQSILVLPRQIFVEWAQSKCNTQLSSWPNASQTRNVKGSMET